MTKIMFIALAGLATVAFTASPFVQSAWAQSAGPIQTLPWGAKQRAKPNEAGAKEADNQQNTLGTPPPAKPVEAAPEPLNVKPKQ